MAITVKHSKVSTIPDDADTSLVRPSDWNADHTLVGLGTMAEQDANNVAITGGSITGVTGVGTVTSVTGTAPVVSSGGNTPAISMPAATTSVNGYLTSTNWNTFNNKANSGANTDITSVALTTGTISTAPTSSTDIVNKSYADSISAGVNFHAACNYATATALPANTYNNGTSGVGATLTATSNGALVIDGHTFVSPTEVGFRVLIKNESTQANNGIYTVTQVGSGSLPYILTRATDYDTSGSGPNEIDAGDMVLVLSGSTNANTSWVQQTPLPITVGTTALVFIEFAKVQTYTAGTGLTLTTNQFSITDTGTAGTYGSATLIPVITTNAQGQVTSVTTAANPQGTVTSVAALTLGTSGTDLASTVATGTTTPVITLNVPTASASNRGALSSADWSTFNGKQATLVSGTNIKTVNGTTLLGSGDLGIITGTYGGTGVNNGSNTITLGGNLTTSGAFTTTLTATANTSVTLPTTGTLTTLAGTETLTNKTIVPRVSSTTSIGSPLAWNSDNFDLYVATAQAGALTINADSGTGLDGEKITFRFTCDATPRVITFTGGTSKGFKPVGVTLTTSGSNFTYTLTASKTTYFGAIYNTSSARWEIVALSQEV